jgi:hypothetical protein
MSVSCCWDTECPQHAEMREIYSEDNYPVLLPEQRVRGWFRRKIEESDKPKVGGRAH